MRSPATSADRHGPGFRPPVLTSFNLRNDHARLRYGAQKASWRRHAGSAAGAEPARRATSMDLERSACPRRDHRQASACRRIATRRCVESRDSPGAQRDFALDQSATGYRESGSAGADNRASPLLSGAGGAAQPDRLPRCRHPALACSPRNPRLNGLSTPVLLLPFRPPRSPRLHALAYYPSRRERPPVPPSERILANIPALDRAVQFARIPAWIDSRSSSQARNAALTTRDLPPEPTESPLRHPTQ